MASSFRAHVAPAVVLVLLAAALTALFPASRSAAQTVAAHWSFEEGGGADAADSSGNDHVGTLGSGVTWRAGQVGAHALDFNGSGAGNVVVPGPVVDTSQGFTVSAWVKPDTAGGFRTAVSIDGNSVSGFYLQLRDDTGKFAFTRLIADSAQAGTFVSSLDPVAVGSWYHLVGVDDVAAGRLFLYVDGVPQGSVPYTGNWKANGDTLIGRGKFGGNPVDFFDGQIDDVTIYQSALSADEIANLDRTARWAFEEGAGGIAQDSSGNGHSLSVGPGAGWAPARIGSFSLRLPGTPNGVATLPTPVVNTAQPFSVSAWVWLDDVRGTQTFASVDGTAASAFALQLRGDTGRFAFARTAADAATAAQTYVSSTSRPRARTWYHLVGLSDPAGGNLRLYVDGYLQGNVPYAGGWRGTGATVIGRGLAGGRPADFARGRIDDVIVVAHPATITEVSTASGLVGGTLNVNAAATGPSVGSGLFGLMFEDINHSGEGGLYGELIQNRSMMASATAPTSWSLVTTGAGVGSVALDPANPLNAALSRSLKLSITTAAAGSRVGAANGGFFGIPVRPRQTYTARLFAKATPGFTGPLTVDVEGTDGAMHARGTITGLTTDWRQYTVSLRASSAAPTSSTNRFVVSASSGSGAAVWLDNVSLMPPLFKGRSNGLRPDLAARTADLDPGFIRIPGGNYLEGNTIDTRFNWKNSLGPVETRPGHPNDAWGYWSTDGLGLLEYLEWAEDVGAEPVLGLYAGYSLNGAHVPLDELGPYVQDALDEIEYVTGSTDTVWGAKRAEDGHPAPFPLRYVEVGNEDFFDGSGSYDGENGRFAQFFDAVKARHPDLKVIATTRVASRTPDLVDDHFYHQPSWMVANSHFYDAYPSSAPKIFVGEWASQEGRPTPNMNAALGDASWLMGLVRNADRIVMEAYAPLMVNVNDDTWPTNLIGYDALTSYASPSYYAQQLLGANHGRTVVSAAYTGTGAVQALTTRDGSGRLYLTVVNPGPSAQSVRVAISSAGRLSQAGTVTTLSAPTATSTNTLTEPTNIVPVTTRIGGLGTSFDHAFPPFSLTILRIG